jgi:ABC-2 type transport system ATP-binding protein
VYENIEIARRLHPGTARQASDAVIERLGLAAYADRRATNLSQGNRQRLGLAKAQVHHPSLLVLDEPANGLDPAGIVEIRELLLELTREEGVTVFMSSHILAEVSRVAQRVGIIHHGHLLEELSVEDLERNRRRQLKLRAKDAEAAVRILTSAGKSPERLGDGSIALADKSSIERPEDVNCLLVEAGVPPTQLKVEEEELEQYFLRLIGVNGEKANA